MVVRSILGNKESGFFVDVGAHDPDRFSNTAWFYRHGWSGVNIEPNPRLAARLRKARPRDVTLNCGVGREKGEMSFYLFSEPAVSTFDPEVAAEHERRKNDWRVVSTQPVPIRPLAEILEENVSEETPIDLLSVDVEGMELQVLESSDWKRFRPTVVLCECHGNDCATVSEDAVAVFMSELGYVAIAKTFSTVVFVQEADAPARRAPESP